MNEKQAYVKGYTYFIHCMKHEEAKQKAQEIKKLGFKAVVIKNIHRRKIYNTYSYHVCACENYKKHARIQRIEDIIQNEIPLVRKNIEDSYKKTLKELEEKENQYKQELNILKGE